MLRACRDVLREEGLLAFHVLEVVVDHPDAVEFGAAFIESEAPYAELLARAGFSDIQRVDLSDAFRATSRAWLDATVALEDGLREAWGDAEYEEFLARRREMVRVRELGMQRRSLYLAVSRP